MRPSRLVPLAAALVLSLGGVSAARAQATVLPADAAAKQLDVGEQWFRSACIECHAVGALANGDFRLKWGGRSAWELFERIRSTMPETNPGSLTPGTYAAIAAYLIRLNGMSVATRLSASDSSALTKLRLTFPAALAPTRD